MYKSVYLTNRDNQILQGICADVFRAMTELRGVEAIDRSSKVSEVSK